MLDVDDHYRLIERAVLEGADKSASSWRTESWARCLNDFKLDPSRPQLVDLTSRELRVEFESFDEDVALATKELEATLSMIEGGGYSAHLANRNGVIISERRSKDSAFYCSTDRVGAVWTEEVGGTNGIGMALSRLSSTAVYLSDHFYAELTGQACAAAPFFGPNGDVLGVVNLSTCNPGLPQLAHRVVFGVAQATADRLETAYFRTCFKRNYTLMVRTEERTPAIFAIDSDFRIVGATRTARSLFKLQDSAIGSRTIWAIFEKIRGNPPVDTLCDSLKELRQLGISNVVEVVLKRPLSITPVGSIKPSAVRSSTANIGKRITTLSECCGDDSQMKRNVAVLKKVFGSGLHILLLGETGVGKDTLTRALHYESERAVGPFVAFNCSAVPETLIDSELFGYSSGAFTGASKDGNSGRIVEADKGTLFLDEIGDMPLQLQTRLLRFLETQEVTPLGSGKMRTVDVQIVAATHQDLQAKVKAGTFRQDLYYRLAGAVVVLPSLREREDLETIIANVMLHIADGDDLSISAEAMWLLTQHEWTGNIRELRNVLTRAVKLAEGKTVKPDDLMLSPSVKIASPSIEELKVSERVATRRNVAAIALPSKKEAINLAEREAILSAIETHNGDAIACIDALGISRATFYRKLKQYGLSLGTR